MREYLKVNRLSLRQFAGELGETENVVRKWVYGQRQPSLPNALRIEEATSGAVTPRELLLTKSTLGAADS